MKYTVTAPVTDKKEVSDRLGRMTLAGISARKSLPESKFKKWSFRSKREAEKFSKDLPGAVITSK